MTTPTPEPEETGPAFEVSVFSNGQGRIEIDVQRTGMQIHIVANTNEVADEEIDEFFRLLPAVVDQGLEQFIQQTAQEGQDT